MKNLILTFLLTFFVGICSAQTEHMKFKGVPMEGTLQSFTNKLKSQGYTLLGIEDGVSLLTGEFAGYKNCRIGAMADNSGMICKVTVIFPDMDKWSELNECYSNYKEMLTEKYGKPVKFKESFDSPLTDDDFLKMSSVRYDQCKYYSVFSCNQGNIELSISHDGLSSCFVMLSYYDNANQKKLKQQIMDDL